MKILNEIYVEFLSKSSNEGFSRNVITALISQIDPTLSEVSDVKTAVSEAVTNAIIHGYEDECGIVSMKGTLYEDAVEIIVSDKGRGIEDIRVAMQPLFTSKPQFERSGMGFTIMESFMDYIEVCSKMGEGTSVKMFKRFESVGCRLEKVPIIDR